MNLWPFGSGDEPEDDTPPEPNSGSTERQFTVYEATITYRNGDTETFEAYGHPHKNNHRVRFRTDVSYSLSGNSAAPYPRGNKRFNYETLGREPELKQIRTETWRVEWETTWDERIRGGWKERVNTDTIELERVGP